MYFLKSTFGIIFLCLFLLSLPPPPVFFFQPWCLIHNFHTLLLALDSRDNRFNSGTNYSQNLILRLFKRFFLSLYKNQKKNTSKTQPNNITRNDMDKKKSEFKNIYGHYFFKYKNMTNTTSHSIQLFFLRKRRHLLFF